MKNKNIASKTSALTFFIILSLQTPSNANDGTWTGGGTTNDWSDPTNWIDGIFAGGADATASFTGTANQTINLGAPVTVGGLSFSSSGGSIQWTLTSNADPAATLTLANTAGTPQLDLSSNAWADISVQIAGSDGLRKTGSGSLLLRGSNSYSGVTHLEAGTIYVGSSNALGASGPGNETIISNGAQLVSNSAVVANESFIISGAGVSGGGALQGTVGSGDITLAADAKISASSSGNIATNGNNLTLGPSSISGTISGNSNITVDGWATISGANSYTGTTAVSSTGRLTVGNTASLYGGNEASWSKENISAASGGIFTLSVGGTGKFTVTQVSSLLSELATGIDNNGLRAGSSIGIDTSAATGVVTYNHVITDSTGAGSGSLGFYKTGTGRLVLTEANTYSGTTWINGGELAVSGAGTLGNGQSTIRMTGGSLDLGGTTQTVRGVDCRTVDYGYGYGLLLDGETTITNGSLVASDNYYLNGHVSANLGGTANLHAGNWNMGGIDVILDGDNTFTGNTYVSNSASLQISSPGALYGGNVSQWTSSRISVEGSSALGVSGLNASQAALVYGNLSNSVDGQGLNAGSAIQFVLSPGDQTWNGSLGDTTGNTGGRIHMSIVNDGVLTLAQTGSFTGSLWTENIKFAANNATGTGTLSTIDGGVADLNGFSGTYRGGYASWVNTNQSSSSTLTMSVASNDPDLLVSGSGIGTGVFQGVIGSEDPSSGSIHLVKAGQGDAQFGSSIYDAKLYSSVKTLTVNGGSLVFNGMSFNYLDNATINSSGRLFVNGALGGPIDVLSGGIVGGHGDVYGTTTVAAGGTVSPGGKMYGAHSSYGQDQSANVPVGSLKLGQIIFANNSTYAYEVDSSVLPSQGADLLVLPGALVMNDMVQLAFGNVAENPESFTPGTVFSLINYVGSWNGGLFYRGGNALEDGEEFFMGQNYWVIDYDATTGGLNFTEDYLTDNGSRFVTLTATAIPEPSSALLGAAASLLLLRRRRA